MLATPIGIRGTFIHIGPACITRSITMPTSHVLVPMLALAEGVVRSLGRVNIKSTQRDCAL